MKGLGLGRRCGLFDLFDLFDLFGPALLLSRTVYARTYTWLLELNCRDHSIKAGSWMMTHDYKLNSSNDKIMI